MELSSIIGILILANERLTEIIKKLLEKSGLELSPIVKKILSMILGTLLGYVLLSTPTLQTFGYNFEPLPLYGGLTIGFVSSLPANVVHDIVDWINAVKKAMELEKKYAKEQRFYQGAEYDLKSKEFDPDTLKKVPTIEPDYDFDMDTGVYDD